MEKLIRLGSQTNKGPGEDRDARAFIIEMAPFSTTLNKETQLYCSCG